MVRRTRHPSRRAGFFLASAVLVSSGCSSHDEIHSVRAKQRVVFDGLFAGGAPPSEGEGNIVIEGPDGARTTKLIGFAAPPGSPSFRVIVTFHLEDGAGIDTPLSGVDIDLCRDPAEGAPCDEGPEGTLTYSQDSKTECGDAGCLTKLDGTLTISASELFVGSVQFHYEDEVVTVGDDSCSPSIKL